MSESVMYPQRIYVVIWRWKVVRRTQCKILPGGRAQVTHARAGECAPRAPGSVLQAARALWSVEVGALLVPSPSRYYLQIERLLWVIFGT